MSNTIPHHTSDGSNVESVDVGVVSDAYTNDADRQAIHNSFEKGNETAAAKNEPLFDNRVGFATNVVNDIQAGKQANPAPAPSGEDDLNNPSATPPADVQARLQKASDESDKLDSSERTNDSTIAPNKPKADILKGFHGG